MALQFTAKTLDYAKNPRNQGEIETPTAVGEVSNPDCGDSTKMYLVVDENGVITDITFETFGCAAAVASSSILTEMVKGKTVDEAYAVTEVAVADELGGLPEKKCTAPWSALTLCAKLSPITVTVSWTTRKTNIRHILSLAAEKVLFT